ncbi:DNA polymerase III subunit delta [Pseudohalioglobus sediminis]|uniref:DNA polymerase III subunit delta n=1 Tax=Pseudohalioglobus sediminis TaxID=2606449 RepID=A0A5B0WU18_9GAMM|nr:DNA polymerase III subunit delta [Pseudohalioglobus sediminis]KAA1189978.1 DNA polymerase III subunit delta [Pseudohalioglobus sediminis]
MRIYPEKLAGQLNKQVLPVYLVSGDEPLLVQECCDLVRQAARKAGCTDRELLDTSTPGFKWDDILASASSMSLFAERKLVELRIPNGKPGAEGSKALLEYLAIAGSGEDILLLVAGKIDKQSTNSKWYKALDAVGGTVQVWPVDASELPRWLQQRVSAAGMSIDNEALQLLCDRVEGNLLAAVQEVEKLKLLASDGQINAATVTAAVSNNARYNLFDMTDKALLGNATAALKMLHGLRGEGSEPTVVLWALLREIRTLQQARSAMDSGQSPQQALASLRVWKNRMSLMQGALSRHSGNSLAALLEQATRVDGSIKGYASGKPWDNLEVLLLALAGAPGQRPA